MQSLTSSSTEIQEHLRSLPPTPSDTPFKPFSYSTASPPCLELVYRRALLSDAKGMAHCATQAYKDHFMMDILNPCRNTYYTDWERGFFHRNRISICSAHKICLLAVDPSNSKIVGVGVFTREGSDSFKQALVKEQWNFLNVLRVWWYSATWSIARWIWPDRSEDKEATARFRSEVEGDFWRNWPERWYCRSMVILPGYHRRGIGSRILGEMQERCRLEGVPLTLEASMQGERMYRARGFRLLKRFEMKVEEEEEAGGFMIYEPPLEERFEGQER